VNVVGSGIVTKNPDQAHYHYGDVVQLTAVAAAGWSLSAWSGDLTGSTNPASLVMSNNRSVTATFTQIPNPVPTITSLSPTTATVGGPAFTLLVTGTDFVNGSTVHWNGAERTTTWLSSTLLSATITASDLAASGQISITVVNPAPGGGVSNVLFFTIVIRPATIGDYKLYLPFVANNNVAALDSAAAQVIATDYSAQVVKSVRMFRS